MKYRKTITEARNALKNTHPDLVDDFDEVCEKIFAELGPLIGDALKPGARDQVRATMLQEISLSLDPADDLTLNRSFTPYLTGLVLSRRFREALEMIERFTPDYADDWQSLFMHGQCVAATNPSGSEAFNLGVNEMVRALNKLAFMARDKRELDQFEARVKILYSFSPDSAKQVVDQAYDYSLWDEIKSHPEIVEDHNERVRTG